MKRDRLLLIIAGIIALLTAIGGYTGLYNRITRDPYHDMKQECYEIIDKAQLWFSRPLAYKGGGKSFIGLDFRQLGLSDQPGAITYHGEYGNYMITRLDQTDFDISATAPDGTEFRMHDIIYDNRPEIEEVSKK